MIPFTLLDAEINRVSKGYGSALFYDADSILSYSRAFTKDLWPAYYSISLAWSRYLLVLSTLQLSVAIA